MKLILASTLSLSYYPIFQVEATGLQEEFIQVIKMKIYNISIEYIIFIRCINFCFENLENREKLDCLIKDICKLLS